jgi:hypothetical protein
MGFSCGMKSDYYSKQGMEAEFSLFPMLGLHIGSRQPRAMMILNTSKRAIQVEIVP